MGEVRRIKDQLMRSFAGGAWHGPALEELLNGIAEEQAEAHPVPNTHNIREIVLHVETWQRIACRCLQGEAPDSTGVKDWTFRSEESGTWQDVLRELEGSFRELCEALDEMPESRLEENVRGHDYSFYSLLHGVIQHNLYHAGQIALLKKSLQGEPK